MNPPDQPENDIIRDHRRQWRDCVYVYPVISRRARGVSIGVNLNISKQCTYRCVYCQINRRLHRPHREVDMTLLRNELQLAVQEVISGGLWDEPRFAETPDHLRRLNDIAFSGDGEPTCLPNFDVAVAQAASVLDDLQPDAAKLVVITNSTQLTQPQVVRALPLLDSHHGEIWAKLDAGSEAWFRRVNQPAGAITLDDICNNILSVARDRPVVIQTLFARLNGQPPDENEIASYIIRLQSLLAGGAQIKTVQLHTVARPPTESFVAALSDDQLDALATTVRAALDGPTIEVYYGQDVPPQPAD
jgi:wyosine [tRNA(Phe)-imidazoG37] synthetase (radical SAM superfamily)